MLSVFPELLFLSPFAATLIRIALAALLMSEGWRQISMSTDTRVRVGGFCEIILAVALLAGIWTQVAALGAVFGLASSLLFPSFRIFPKSTIWLALAMAVSLVVTGAGAFAFDLPL